MNKMIILLLFLLPFMLNAQDAVPEHTETQSSTVSMGGAIGSVTVDNVIYSEIRFLPEVSFGKVGIGLDIDLLFDKFGNVRKEDWNEPRDIVSKIYYVRYAQRNDPFYCRVGGFPNYSLAHGLIMNQYSNMLRTPGIRQIGFMSGGNIKYHGLGVEVFNSDIVRNEIIAGRVHIKPLETVKVPFLKKLVVGATLVTDRNQYGGLRDVVFDTDLDGVPDQSDIDADNDGDLDASPYVLHEYPILEQIQGSLDQSYPNYDELLKSKKESVTEYGLDYEIPVFQKPGLYISHYAEVAKIQDYKMGFIFPGFYSKFLIFDLNAEMRHFQDQFIPGYFDRIYDQQRASLYYNNTEPDSEVYAIHTKKEILSTVKASTGWFASVTTSFWEMIYFTIAYQHMYNEEKRGSKSLTGVVKVNPKILKQIKEASITYAQLNVERIKGFRSPNAILEGKVAYAVAPNTYLIGRYQEIYTDSNGDGRITQKREVQQIYGTSIEFRF